jgi:hypothetical protein
LDYDGLYDAALIALVALNYSNDVILQRLREAVEPQPGIPEAEQAPEWQLFCWVGFWRAQVAFARRVVKSRCQQKAP